MEASRVPSIKTGTMIRICDIEGEWDFEVFWREPVYDEDTGFCTGLKLEGEATLVKKADGTSE